MQIESLQDLENLILLLKQHKISAVKLGDVEVHLSNLALVDGMEGMSMANEGENPNIAVSELSVPDQLKLTAKEEEDLLFYSAGPG